MDIGLKARLPDCLLDEGWKRWRKITLLVGVPAIILGHVNAFWPSEEDKVHRPEFVAYEYLRIRKKAFPWGDGTKSLIHNPHTNALPDGYEDAGH
eukprot:TCALIF_10304-PA protein Name:"Similar to Cox6a1 Cytochrome c oxidase subunit 6A1, mitochondrial (Rattus norvegicus)" AED:0.09 eAED:0.09 QI:0/0/0/1/1/1/2/0/94